MSEFTHFNQQGRAKMVDITEKQPSHRSATAQTSILVNEQIYQQINNHAIKKGDVLAVAQVAGIMAAKQTSTLIPMCHPIPISGVDIAFDWLEEKPDYRLTITVSTKTKGSTGVEMEALTAASICALTVYDMCKAIDKGMVIGPTYLVKKSGGKNGDYNREGAVD
ncbi:cyclic pyranopterin monophosphate synthase MoaC [Pseudobacillus wudalianchiensis]|uniref:Cyclic pyranopterin monophosphate synthase n=1 Tax=Pseudobacillus wudalianchiensis TaxID=1743143 RepID=A0A1B9ANA7_9BACI|nr:cyclic pyranopterin monophosphate synthase MoaC [Bacillus wudalianchiensis]OCA85128.1 molybdenum cofactor biosynthesis protein C [Bacillus wudalianchiensis]